MQRAAGVMEVLYAVFVSRVLMGAAFVLRDRRRERIAGFHPETPDEKLLGSWQRRIFVGSPGFCQIHSGLVIREEMVWQVRRSGK
jgi:hypothetical protein